MGGTGIRGETVDEVLYLPNVADPPEEGMVRFYNGDFRMKDQLGVFNPRKCAFGATSGYWVEDEFTATEDQTIFTLSSTPTDSDSVQMFVNGVIYDDTADYTVSGTTVTWLDAKFTMDTGDKILIRYI